MRYRNANDVLKLCHHLFVFVTIVKFKEPYQECMLAMHVYPLEGRSWLHQRKQGSHKCSSSPWIAVLKLQPAAVQLNPSRQPFTPMGNALFLFHFLDFWKEGSTWRKSTLGEHSNSTLDHIVQYWPAGRCGIFKLSHRADPE